MKKGYLRLLIVCLAFIVVTIFNLFQNILNELTLIIVLTAFLGTLFYFIKFEKDNMRFKKDILLTVFIYGLIYYFITYFLGVFTSFYRNPHSLNILSILSNIVPLIIIIILAEISRYMIVTKGSKYKSILVLTTIAFIVLDLTLIIHTFDFSVPDRILEFVVMILIPSISKNIVLTYLTFKVGYKSPILYRLIFEVPVFILPIFPNFGLYIASLIDLIKPTVIAYIVYLSFDRLRHKEIQARPNHYKSNIIILTLAIPLFIIVLLTTGWFRYSALTIGSDSMRPNIARGDVVIVERLDNDELYRLNEGDVLVFNYEDRVIVHRLIRILEVNGVRYYYTKGDNNETEDGRAIPTDDIIGRTILRFRLIGLPTVWLNELLN